MGEDCRKPHSVKAQDLESAASSSKDVINSFFFTETTERMGIVWISSIARRKCETAMLNPLVFFIIKLSVEATYG